jgi:transcription termination factor Rho
MTERRRPPRRGRGQRPSNRSASEAPDDSNPYRDDAGDGIAAPPTPAAESAPSEAPPPVSEARGQPAFTPPAVPSSPPPPAPEADRGAEYTDAGPSAQRYENRPDAGASPAGGAPRNDQQQQRQDYRGERGERGERNDRGDRGDREFGGHGRNGRRRRNRGRGGPRREQQQPPQQVAIAASADTRGWFDPARDGGFVRRAGNSYLADAGDAFVPPQLVRQFALRKSDLIDATVGRDQRGRLTVVDIRTVNDVDPNQTTRRAEFNSLTASYPERKLFLETGRPAKGGAELIRRAVDLIAPIGYGQRGLIVAPARAGKTTLLHAITEGIAINHPNAALIILLVDERPEEVSEAISWGVGEVIASSFDQPAERHVEVTEMVLERARRLVETGRDVVIVLDSLTRMARAHNTVERGSGRTLSGGLDATAMAKPKAFFGSARAIPASSGGGSLTIIATALVETGSRMDDVIFEEFKGTGNSEIKLDRSLAEKRIYPAIDIGTSGTRREEKLFRPDQLDGVYTLRRGLSQMPPQSAMEWLIKRIAATPSNDQLLSGL